MKEQYKSCRSTIGMEKLVIENEEFDMIEKKLIDLYTDICMINNIGPSFSRKREDIKCLDNCTGVYVLKDESYILDIISTGNINQSLKSIDKDFEKLDIYLTVDNFDAIILKHWLTKIYTYKGPVYIKWLTDNNRGKFSIKTHDTICLRLYPIDIMKNVPVSCIESFESFSRNGGTYVLKDGSNIVYVGSTEDVDTRSKIIFML